MSGMELLANCMYCICLLVGFDIIIEHPNPHVMKTCELIKGRKCTITTYKNICRYITNFVYHVNCKTIVLLMSCAVIVLVHNLVHNRNHKDRVHTGLEKSLKMMYQSLNVFENGLHL